MVSALKSVMKMVIALGFTCINGYCVPIGGISSDPVGIITSIIDGPGIGYTSGDEVYLVVASINPFSLVTEVLLDLNRMTPVRIQFDFYPGAGINTKTGYGANVFPVMKFVPQYLAVDNAVNFGRYWYNTNQCNRLRITNVRKTGQRYYFPKQFVEKRWICN